VTQHYNEYNALRGLLQDFNVDGLLARKLTMQSPMVLEDVTLILDLLQQFLFTLR